MRLRKYQRCCCHYSRKTIRFFGRKASLDETDSKKIRKRSVGNDVRSNRRSAENGPRDGRGQPQADGGLGGGCVTVISKIGQKLGFIYVFGGSFIVPYVFVTNWSRAN